MADEEVVIGVRAEGADKSAEDVRKVIRSFSDLNDMQYKTLTALGFQDAQLQAMMRTEYGRINIMDRLAQAEKDAMAAADAALVVEADAAAKQLAIEEQLNISMKSFRDNQQTVIDNTAKMASEFAGLGSAGIKLDQMMEKLAAAKTFEDKVAVIIAYTKELDLMAKYLKDGVSATGGATDAYKKYAQAVDIAKQKLTELAASGNNAQMAFMALAGTATGFEKVDSAITGAEKAIARFDQKEQSGSRVWQRDVDLIAQQYRRLELAIRNTFAAGEPLPGQVAASQQRIRAEMERTIQTWRQFKDAQDEVNRRVAEGGYRFTSFGMAIRDASKQYGPAVAQALTFGQAIKMGWQEGVRLREVIGTDMQAYDDVGENVKRIGASFQNEFNLMIASVINLQHSIGTLDWKRAKQDLDEFGIMGYNSFKKIGDVSKVTANEMAGFQTLVKAGITVQNALAVSSTKLVEVQRLHTLALAAGKEGIELWEKAVIKAKGNVDELVKSVAAEEEALIKLAVKVADAAKNHETLAEKVDKAIGKNKEFAAAMKEAADIANSQEKATKGLTETIIKEIGSIQQYMKMGPLYNAEVKTMGAALGITAANQASLTKEQRENLVVLAEKLTRYAQLNESEKMQVKAEVDMLAATANQTKAQGEMHKVLVNGKEVWTNLTEEEVKAKDATIQVKDATGQVVTHLGNMNQKLTETAPKAEAAGVGLDHSAVKMKEAGDAAGTLQERLNALLTTIGQVGSAADAMGSKLHNAASAGTEGYNANQVEGGVEVPNSSGGGGVGVTQPDTNPFVNTSEGP